MLVVDDRSKSNVLMLFYGIVQPALIAKNPMYVGLGLSNSVI
jgi:hypothetical protein